MYDLATLIVMLDPMEGFAGVNKALGGERITVGAVVGSICLNCSRRHSTFWIACLIWNPWSEQISWVLTFCDTFFTHVANNPLGERKQTLRRAVQEAYERQGITRDPATHHHESSTRRDRGSRRPAGRSSHIWLSNSQRAGRASRGCPVSADRSSAVVPAG